MKTGSMFYVVSSVARQAHAVSCFMVSLLRLGMFGKASMALIVDIQTAALQA